MSPALPLLVFFRLPVRNADHGAKHTGQCVAAGIPASEGCGSGAGVPQGREAPQSTHRLHDSLTVPS